MRAGFTVHEIEEMDGDDLELWGEAIDAREELDFQNAMNFENTKRLYDKRLSESRRSALRTSEYRWHDKLRLPVDLRRSRR